MNIKNQEIKITVGEIAKTLGWTYTTTDSIRRRKSPKERYETFKKKKQKLRDAKVKIQEEFSKNEEL